MLDTVFKKIFAEPEAPTPEDPEADLRKSVAALLVEAARADENYEDSERAIIDRVLAQSFEISADAAAALRAAGEAAQTSALDIQQFTRYAKQLTEDDKTAFIEGLWEIILSDGARDPFEDALMRRICGLIYYDDRKSGEARARVAARLNAT